LESVLFVFSDEITSSTITFKNLPADWVAVMVRNMVNETTFWVDGPLIDKYGRVLKRLKLA